MYGSVEVKLHTSLILEAQQTNIDFLFLERFRGAIPMKMWEEVKNTSFYVNIIKFKIVNSERELFVARRIVI
jgi:hypothetical protein